MNLGSKRIRASLFLAATLVVVPVLAHHTDSIYPANTWWVCGDGQTGSLGTLLFCLNETHSPLTYFVEYSIVDDGWWTITSTMAAEYEPTDLTTLDLEFFGGPVYTGDNQTDIIYQQGSLPGTLPGVTYCDQPITLTRCGQQYVVLASNNPGTDFVCHETGHSIGLLHGQQAAPQLANSDASLGCMRNPASGAYTLGAHNVAQINGEY